MKMETTSLKAAIEAFRLQTRLFLNVIADIDDEDAAASFGGSPNHISWIAGHIVSTRYMLGTVLGLTDREPFPELFERGKGVQENAAYPSLADIGAGWKDFAVRIIERLESLTEEDLSTDPPIQTPVSDHTLRGFITFIAHHEAYHIGQLSLARRHFGYEPMSYA